ncbi:MAG: methyltransferase domain-containing protein [Proteobacteria bacterium]|nr:methyltransferase domain-containing protein [Pseudomonadota bacterium]
MRYRYQTVEFGDLDVHLRTLRDTNEFDDPAGRAEALGVSPSQWSLFGVVWSSSLVLAGMMVDIDIAGRRILEVGCGIGLASLVLNQRGADITAMDRHPEAGRFLKRNAELNDGPEIAFECSNWHDADDLGGFDLIIGSDLLYSREPVEGLSKFADEHALPTNEVIVVDPGRGQAGRFGRAMVDFGFSHSVRSAALEESQQRGRPGTGRIQVHSFHRGPASA